MFGFSNAAHCKLALCMSRQLTPVPASAAQVLGMIDNPHYLYRMTVLSAIAALAPVITHDVLVDSMLPVVINAGKDKVRLTVLAFQFDRHWQALLQILACCCHYLMTCALMKWTQWPGRNFGPHAVT